MEKVRSREYRTKLYGATVRLLFKSLGRVSILVISTSSRTYELTVPRTAVAAGFCAHPFSRNGRIVGSDGNPLKGSSHVTKRNLDLES
jgi:hypothetical protein